MKIKISEWGNSHGIRLSSALLEHLKVQAGDEVEVNLTKSGMEIVKKESLKSFTSVKQEILDDLLSRTDPVELVKDPYAETDVAYVVIDLNPCAPVIRQVAKDSENSFATLAEAKEAARQVIQASIAEAQKSMTDLRQHGINNITYISL